VSISGRDRRGVEAARALYGFEEALPDWREQVDDERVGLFDNTGPNHLHVEPTLAAIANGKHVVCEKPLATSADDALQLWRAAEAAGVVHLCAFNYRFFPAVRLARDLIASGRLGEIRHFRSRFLVAPEHPDQPPGWRFDRAAAGSGVLGDLGSHHIDLVRYLVGEPLTVSALLRGYHADEELDDSFVAVFELAQGATATLEASRASAGHTVTSELQVDGTDASLSFAVARLNELQLHEPAGTQTILVTEASHPYMRFWFPHGHVLGWGDSFVHELDHVIRAIAGEVELAPHGATFEDGYRCAEVSEAIMGAARRGDRQPVSYRGL
jgi:predicted dehydrogenase